MKNLHAKKKLVAAVTGMSLYSPQVQQMIEKELGAIPVFINQNDPNDLDWILNKCDFAVLAGGADWSPTSLGREIVAHENLNKFDIPRDKRELHIMRWAKDNSKNIFGICRGHQGIGLFHNMQLNLDITGSTVVHNPSANDIKMDGYPVHFVHINKPYQEQFGFGQELVNSFHHQALPYWNENKDHEKGINIVGWAYTHHPDDKIKYGIRIVELMKTQDNLWLSCQWHPELDYQDNPASRKVINLFKEMLLNNGLELSDDAIKSLEIERQPNLGTGV